MRPQFLLQCLIVLICALSASVFAHASEKYAGKITKMEITQDPDSPFKAIFELWLQPAHKGDQESDSGEVLSEFDEERIVVFGSGNTFNIILDSIGFYDTKFSPKIPVDFITGMKLSDYRGSHLNPDILYTDEGRDIKSAEISLEVNSFVFYQFLSFDRSVADTLILRFAVIKKKDIKGESVNKVTEVVDITAVDVPSAKVVSKDEPVNAAASPESMDPMIANLSKLSSESYVTIVYPLRYVAASHANELVRHKLSLLGEISMDEDNPSLLITDRRDYVMSIVRVLKLIDRPIPQVEIAVRILEVSWNKNERIGFNWAGFPDAAAGAAAAGTEYVSMSGAGLSGFIAGQLNQRYLKQLNLQMDMLTQKNKLSLLAAPRLKVINNADAVFHAGSKIPIFRKTNIYNADEFDGLTHKRNNYIVPDDSTSVSYDYTQDTRSIDNRVTTVEEALDVGVKLTVKPRITQSGEIILTLTPDVSEIAGWRDESDRPIINTRTLTTTVKVSDGDTVLIAGLFKENEVESRSGVPVLHKLPLLGGLFRKSRDTGEKTEVVFVLNIKLVD